jgi:hypothetical protein
LANVYYHDALPDGIDYDYEEGHYVLLANGSVFVESNWGHLGVSLFVQSSPAASIVFLVFGIMLTIASFVALYFARRDFTKRYKIL